MVKKIAFICLILLFTIMLVSSVFAITGSIGNARMVLKATTGDVIEKSILIKNINDVPVYIELNPSGDLADYITLEDNNFTLEAGDETNAKFSIKVKKAGTTESKINIKFSPIGEKNGVGLASTIIVIAQQGSIIDEIGLNKGSTLAIVITSIVILVLIVVVVLYFIRNKKIERENKPKKSTKR